jgi:hypothetical protein
MTDVITQYDPSDLPSINDPTNFNDKAQSFIQQKWPQSLAELNVAFQALNLVSTNSTSTTSNSIGTGSKTYTVDTGKSYVAGMFVMIADTAAPTTNYNFGQVTSYNSGTGALVVDVTNTKGSGTKTAWTISQSSAGGFTSADLQNQVATKATTTGSGSAYVLTIAPALATLTGALVKAVLHADPSGSPVININGLGTKNLKYLDSTGTKNFVTTAQAKLGHLAVIEYDGTDLILLNPLPSKELTATGSAPYYAARAWLNFNGSGTIATRASGNVSSVVDNGTGNYNINFTTAMPDTNYTVTGTTKDTLGSSSSTTRIVAPYLFTTGAVSVNTTSAAATLVDCDFVGIAIFR